MAELKKASRGGYNYKRMAGEGLIFNIGKSAYSE